MPNFRWVQLETSSSSLFCLSPPLIAVSNPFAQSYGAVGGDFNELIPSHVANGVFDGEHPTPAWQADGIKLTGWIDRLDGSLFNAYLLPHFLQVLSLLDISVDHIPVPLEELSIY